MSGRSEQSRSRVSDRAAARPATARSGDRLRGAFGAAGPLGGTRVLIVEDEYYMADALSLALRGEGAEIVGPVGYVADAVDLVANGRVEAAVVDIGLHGEKAFALLDLLADRAVPTVLVTGYDEHLLPARHRSLRFIQKPACEDKIVRALTVVRRAGGGVADR